jgi:hypothetical protein
VGGLIGHSPSSIYRGGLDPLQVGFRVNPASLANKSHKKFRTLTDSAHTQMVRAATVDRNIFLFHQHVEIVYELKIDSMPSDATEDGVGFTWS